MAETPVPHHTLLEELQQTRPFRSLAQEMMLSVARTASVLDRHMARTLEEVGISTAQYNVLRILRGAGDEGLPTLTIRERMVDAAAAITRLVDKLERAGLVTRERLRHDRRTVRCRITAKGLQLLARLDPVVVAIEECLSAPLDPEAARTVIAQLEIIRARIAAREASVSE